MIGSNEGYVECKPLGINDWHTEGIKEQPLLEYKYKIIDGEGLLTTEGSPELIYDGIMLDNSGGNLMVFQLGHLMVQHLDSLTVQYWVLLIIPKWIYCAWH